MKKEKPSHSVWSNVRWELKIARQTSRGVPYMCCLMAIVGVLKSLTGLYATPVILRCVESHAPLGALLGAIAGFTLAMMALSALVTYLNQISLFPRLDVRMEIIRRMNCKRGTTSYPNTEDPAFLRMVERASRCTGSNRAPAEHIWTTLTDLLKNLLGFVVYLALLGNLHSVLIAVTLVTAVAGFFAQEHLSGWGYRHREERAEIEKSQAYFSGLANSRAFAKDLRIFGMIPWLREIGTKSVRLGRDFAKREQRVYLGSDLVDVALSFLRNGLA